ncbi:uncharacterized protein ACHE_11737S [Aspergillus chevalieri]|uniref:chitinase n=1 Tax=Aspergillus chevalieri TaxID=182096 RepID=A0A7R7ZJ70_ASPCH|nr:uncharacterized protein ACHE_11737S [Aspergillus chevalieri]BCR84335.1 hypothetical protein ACHE_11737S [Aspergillus chevalieri]
MTPLKKLTKTAIVLFPLTLLFFLIHNTKQPSPNILIARDTFIPDDIPSYTHPNLTRRQDYTCGPGRPCSNGACCGASGNCGYGKTYCGDGCVSNCNAVAECGKDARPAGKKCPLNTCCSQYGFCGTTEEFCTKKHKCQSNCVLDPKPPGGSAKGQTQSKVIGYYESWTHNKKCHQIAPSDLPVTEMTHLNYAFAYIDPKSYELVTMKDEIPESLFQKTVDTKQYNKNLKVWVSVGGWDFSDNDTITQPIFSDISSTEAKRKRFADKARCKLTNRLDIDWEYPGAPDRGGKPEDTKNFVALMKTLRSTFDASPRELGISFTIPSSYWYLRWFDMPGMMKYADWTNLMSYDLHGVWDANNPIGSIVQGHTNLTDIKKAASLLWRVGIKPSQIALGFGFYGRSFELSDPTCSKPGCPFSGGAKPGPCSATSGVLMHYEIQAMINQLSRPTIDSDGAQVSALKPTHDEDAAVNYVVFDNNQWVSYDDAKTFKQKLDWANGIGMGGSLIWASDTDNSQYSAMSEFTGKRVFHPDLASKALQQSELTIVRNHVGENGQDCEMMKDCVDPDIVRCPNGHKKMGWDKAGCKSGGKLICCPTRSAPHSCTWRGSGGDCNGQCHAGESTLFKSSCGTDCKTGEKELARTRDGCNLIHPHSRYCCPSDTLLHDCTWRGSLPDCPDAKCKDDEVAILNNGYADGWMRCSWGRKKTNCCKVSKPPPPQISCKITSCNIIDNLCDDSLDTVGTLSTRDKNGQELHTFEKRGNPRDFHWKLTAGLVMTEWSRSRTCGTPRLHQVNIDINDPPPAMSNTEHPVPLLIVSRFAATANHGRLPLARPIRTVDDTVPQGRRTRTRAIPDPFWQNVWGNAIGLPAGLPPVASNSPDLRQPGQRIFERIGSNTNPSHFVLLRDSVNAIKGRLEGFASPIDVSVWERYVRQAAGRHGSELDVMTFMAPLRDTVAVFQYLRDPMVMERMDAVASGILDDLRLIELHTQGGDGLSAHWNEFYPYYFEQVSQFARNWLQRRIDYARRQYRASDNYLRESVERDLLELENQIPDMKYPWED